MNWQARSLGATLDEIINLLTGIGSLPTNILHRIVFCSVLKAGLSFQQAKTQHIMELNKLMHTIPASYRGLVTGKLYLQALRLVKEFKKIIKNRCRPVLLKEANLQYIQNSLRRSLGKVDKVAVLDCASIPEIVTFAPNSKR